VNGEGSVRQRVDWRQQTGGESGPTQSEVHRLAAPNAATDPCLPPERNNSLGVQQGADHDRADQHNAESLLDSATRGFAGVRERRARRKQR